MSEFHEALQHLPDNKARSLDGFPGEFYKEFWPMVAATFFKMVNQIQKDYTLFPNINSCQH